MAKKILILFFGSWFILFFTAMLLYRPVIKPWHVRWGAVENEVRMVLPGDEIVTGTGMQTTRAIDIHTPATRIWPWLVQMGQGRGGLYSYDALENLVGCDIHTLESIDPALQDLKVGDTIKLGPQSGLPYYKVKILEPEHALVLQSFSPSTGEPGETWGFYLVEKPNAITRLVIRHRGHPSQDSTERVVNSIFEPISFVMEHRMLYGIRDHAENH